MAKRNNEPIKTRAFVTIKGILYNVDELNEAQRGFVGAHIHADLFNGAFKGRAECRPVGLPPLDEVFPDAAPGWEKPGK